MYSQATPTKNTSDSILTLLQIEFFYCQAGFCGGLSPFRLFQKCRRPRLRDLCLQKKTAVGANFWELYSVNKSYSRVQSLDRQNKKEIRVKTIQKNSQRTTAAENGKSDSWDEIRSGRITAWWSSEETRCKDIYGWDSRKSRQIGQRTNYVEKRKANGKCFVTYQRISQQSHWELRYSCEKKNLMIQWFA